MEDNRSGVVGDSGYLLPVARLRALVEVGRRIQSTRLTRIQGPSLILMRYPPMVPVLIFTESPADADMARSFVGVQICSLSKCNRVDDRACLTTLVSAALSVRVSRLLNMRRGSPKGDSAACDCDGPATLAGGGALEVPLVATVGRVVEERCATPL